MPARIIFTDGPFKGHDINIPESHMVIGTADDANITFKGEGIAPRHAEFNEGPSGWSFRELEGASGLILNGTVASSGTLKQGDEIRIGDYAFRFETDSGAVAHAAVASTATTPVVASTPAPVVASSSAASSAPQPVSAQELEGEDLKIVRDLNAACQSMQEQLGKVIVGQSEVIEQVLIAVFCRGHALLVGVPGLAKTLLVSSLSRVLHLDFKRIQFTPDLMPSDITGTEVLEEDQATGKRHFRFVHGPIFTNMLLADEINRTPPKTQAALLEAMQERHVTVGERTEDLPAPFFVLATQNPIEQEGTFPLPEAQLDRFLFNIRVDYPSRAEEEQIIKQVTGDYEAKLDTALSGEDVIRLQKIVRRVPVADHVVQYAATLARASRPKSDEAPDFVREMVGWGAGPRAGISLVTAAKARAILRGRYHCTTEDVQAVALPVMRHRVLTTFNAEAAGVTSDEIVRMLLDHFNPQVDLTV